MFIINLVHFALVHINRMVHPPSMAMSDAIIGTLLKALAAALAARLCVP